MFCYSLKFTKFSKYAPSLVFDHTDEMNNFVAGGFDNFQEKFNSAMLHDNMNISRKIHGQREKLDMPGGKDLLMVILLRVGLRFKTSLGSRRECQIEFLRSYLMLGMRGCLTLSVKREGTLVHQQRCQLVESVARSTMVIVLRERTIVLLW